MEEDDKGCPMIRMGECFFWYRPTRVVPDKRPLNGCMCVCTYPMWYIRYVGHLYMLSHSCYDCELWAADFWLIFSADYMHNIQANAFAAEWQQACLVVLYMCNIELLIPSVLWRCWLGGRMGIRPVKNWVVGYWRGYLSGARCRLVYGPADTTGTHCLLLQ